MDDTRIDAAPTPAHIFAYRAFRSVFVRSPESSPLRPPTKEPQHLHDNKENARHVPTRGSRFVTSPVQGKRDADLASEALNLSLTPKRPCINPVSPTKSILKKSNVLTPRRASLRDAAVTFKDISMSVSPELTRRGSPTRVRSQPELRNASFSVSMKTSAPVLRPTTATSIGSSNTVGRENANLQAPTDFDLDNYITQTEKEMRRLIKYGQKWRAHAKKQEEENARLRAQIAELQKERDKLKPNDENDSESVRVSISTEVTKRSTRAEAHHIASAQELNSARRESHTRHASQEKWKVPLDTVDSRNQHSKPRDTLERAAKRSSTQPEISKTTTYASRQSETARRSDKETKSDVGQWLPYEVESTLRKDDQPLKNTHIAVRDQRDKTKHMPEVVEQIFKALPEEDRKAAARERLRLRREAKVASVRASSAPSAQATKFGHDMKGDNEESQVDWMAIA